MTRATAAANASSVKRFVVCLYRCTDCVCNISEDPETLDSTPCAEPVREPSRPFLSDLGRSVSQWILPEYPDSLATGCQKQPEYTQPGIFRLQRESGSWFRRGRRKALKTTGISISLTNPRLQVMQIDSSRSSKTRRQNCQQPLTLSPGKEEQAVASSSSISIYQPCPV